MTYTLDHFEDIAVIWEGYWNWREFHLMRGPDGFLFVGEASGCSCNEWGYDGADPADFERVPNWSAAIKKAQEWSDEPSQLAEFVQEVAELKPAPFVEPSPRGGAA